MTTAPDLQAEERHASWAELFFDLVAVAGVAGLAHVLEGEFSADALGLYAVMFLAFWLSWTAYMLYGNVRAGQTHLVRLLVGMFGLGVMAAAVPGVAHTVLQDGHDEVIVHAFAIAYFAARFYAASGYGRGGQMILDFPAAQYTLGAVPWLVSVWVDAPYSYWLWVLGVLIDLAVLAFVSPDDIRNSFDRRVGQMSSRKSKRPVPTLVEARLDAAHLAERLGLFVIIVLGEGVVQVVRAAWEVEWNGALFGSAVASFFLLVGMFGLSLLYGHAGVPHLRPGSLPLRSTLVLHLAITATIAALAAVLAGVVEHGHEPLDTSQRWLLCGGVASYFLIGWVAALFARGSEWRVAVWWLLSGVGVPVLLGALATEVSGIALVWYVVLVVAAHLWSERAIATRQARLTPSQ